MSASSPRACGTLASLTAAALALPAFQAAADARDETRIVSLRASQYLENDLPASQLASGSEGDRYDISLLRLRAGAPVFDSFRVTADLGYETMSGASPWFVQPDADGRPVQVMSGATIDETRTDVSIDTRYYSDTSEHAIVVGYSTENDYEAINIGLETLYSFEGAQTSINLGAGYSDDTVKPTDGGSVRFPYRIDRAGRDSANAVIGLTHVLNPTTVLQGALSFTRQSGYLSDPYKLTVVDGAARPDTRPDDRNQVAWSLRLRHRFADWNASLHADYRYYSDSWKIDSHTLELGWYQDLGERWRITPSLRYYSQSQAGFYRPYYVAETSDNLYSSDYRLSPYGAFTAGLLVRRLMESSALSLSLQYYDSDARYALGKVDVANPGLVDFVLATLGFDFSI